LIASFIVFSLPRLLPGDVVQLMLEERAYGKDLDDLRAKLGLNRPIYVQDFEWLGSVVQGHLGESLWTKRPVVEELTRRLPVSLKLGSLALLFSVSIALPIGILAAVRQDTLADYLFRSVAIFGLSIPGFWLATLVVVLPAIWWNWSPPIQFTEFSADPWAQLSSSSCRPSSWASPPRRPSCASPGPRCWKFSARTTCVRRGRRDRA